MSKSINDLRNVAEIVAELRNLKLGTPIKFFLFEDIDTT